MMWLVRTFRVGCETSGYEMMCANKQQAMNMAYELLDVGGMVKNESGIMVFVSAHQIAEIQVFEEEEANGTT